MQQQPPAGKGTAAGTAAAGRDRQAGDFRRWVPLLALPAVPALPGVFSLVLLAGILLLWLRAKPARREVWLVGGAAAVVAALLLGTLVEARSSEARAGSVRAAWDELWGGLDRVALQADTRVEAPPEDDEALLRVFRELSSLVQEQPGARSTLHLIDPDGNVVAWAGAGLLHDLRGEELPREGRGFRASFSAATLLSVRPLGRGASGWRVVAGRSFSIDALPSPTPRGWEGRTLRWTLARPGESVAGDLLSISLPETPTLVIEEVAGKNVAGEFRWPPSRRWASLVLGLLLLAVALSGAGSREAFRQREAGSPLRADLGAGSAALAGVVAISLAGDLPGPLIAGLAAALALVLLSTGRGIRSVHPGASAALGLVAVGAPLAAVYALQWASSPIDLAAEVLSAPTVVALRLLLFALAFGGFNLIAGARRQGGEPAQRWAWLAVASLLAAAALADRQAAALGGLALGGALFGLWRHGAHRPQRFARVALVVLVSALAAATSWEIAYRHALRRETGGPILSGMAFPGGEELDRLARSTEDYFIGLDLRNFAPLGAEELGRQDLAYEIWHHSPLARGGVLSALVVFSGDRPVSRFAFGLPMSEEEGEVDWTPTRWPQQVLPTIWQDAVISGEADMASNGEPWGWVRYWLWPQPGFRLGGSGLDVLAAGLLRGGPVAGRLAPGPARYALYSDQGEAVIVPWNDTPPLEPSLLDGGERVVVTSAGRAWAFAARGEDGVRVLYLPIPRTLAALERVGIHAVSVLIVLLVLGMTSLPTLLPRRGLRQTVGHALRSYSKRLVVVYSLLLTVPILAMNATVLRMVEKRLQREQRAAGQAALESAQRVLGEYVLSLEPGFGFESALDDELLIWLSGVVHHEVNLYWRSSVLASSKPELFTAGLLPSRIPGEIYSRLTLLGHTISSRVNEAGGVDYLELYAPLKVPGVPGNQARLFLSTPLSAQQKEVSAEVAELRRKALLGTTLLLLLLVAIGTRFARSFTTPLQEIVQGTQRIAAGEASLKLAPRESELATLVEAIDQMAGRIAEGRRSLLREKGVVERIVESITSGVVSLDGEGRVLMRNRVAAELLGVEVGEALAEALQREARLGSVYEFVDSAGERTRQGTVGLREESGDEREWSLVWVPLPGEGEPAALLVVEDVTEVLRGQRLQAWAEMARIIAHEIKNPLTPIRLSAEHMTRVYHSDPEHFEQVFESCTSNILRQVEELQQISREFSTYSRIPRIELTEGDLAVAAAEVVEGYRAAPPKGVKISFSAEAAQIPARFDAKLLRRAVRNLVENALQATSDGGEVRVDVGTANGRPRISVIDTGPGVAAEVLPRIFDPYFSTYDTGTGLGLPIAKRIAEEHGGQISARNRPEGGLEVTIFLGAPPSTP